MSRAYKQGLVDETLNTGFSSLQNVEVLSGADLEQLRLTALNGINANSDREGKKTLEENNKFPGDPNAAALTGADLLRYMGEEE